MRKTQIVWRRTGKEHGEDSFRLNPLALVDEHIKGKIARQRATHESAWRWWQLNDDVLLEIPEPSEYYKTTTRIYYLPKRHLVAVADLRFGGFHNKPQRWEPYWYVHVGAIELDEAYGAWVFSDLFADVTATRDGSRYRVKDLDDLANVMRLGIIDVEKAAFILERTQALVDAMKEREFPFPELRDAMDADGKAPTTAR